MIQITKKLNEADTNIMEYIKGLVKVRKYNKIQNAITQAGLWGDELKATHYLGKREDDSLVHYLQIDFIDHESLYVVVEVDEIGQEIRT